ncbi:MAG: metallophosphatase, partial [Anaerolineales bacterium]|nr:metallophosphatase [Anaerolineales bacterium]
MNLKQSNKYIFLITVLAVAIALAACQAPPAGGQQEITVLYTNDEHGWMQGVQSGQGAAHLLGLLSEEYGYQEDPSVILLSGGDNWTGPAISTWFEGQSMVEVMNEMGYSASVIGNHEFDFGLEALKQRITEADYPYLSANIRNKSDGEIPRDLGIEPFSIIEVNGIKVALIGLTTTLTPAVTNQANVADYDFIDYETALREFVPAVKEQGAELILVPSHICTWELAALAERVSDLGIAMLGGGHCNEFLADQVAGTVIL